MSESDLINFISQRTTSEPGAYIQADRLYTEYCYYCYENGVEPVDRDEFEAALAPTYSIVTLQYGRFYSGLLVTNLGGEKL